MASLEGWGSTIELHPRDLQFYGVCDAVLRPSCLKCASVPRSSPRPVSHPAPAQPAGTAGPWPVRHDRADASVPGWSRPAGRPWSLPIRAGHAGVIPRGGPLPVPLAARPSWRSCCADRASMRAHEHQPPGSRLGVGREVVLEWAEDVRRNRHGAATGGALGRPEARASPATSTAVAVTLTVPAARSRSAGAAPRVRRGAGRSRRPAGSRPSTAHRPRRRRPAPGRR